MSLNTWTVPLCRRCIPRAPSQWCLYLLHYGCSCMGRMRHQWIGDSLLFPCHKLCEVQYHPSQCKGSLCFQFHSWMFRGVELTRQRSGRINCSPLLCTCDTLEIFHILHRFWTHSVWTSIVRTADQICSSCHGSLQTQLQIWNWLRSSS